MISSAYLLLMCQTLSGVWMNHGALYFSLCKAKNKCANVIAGQTLTGRVYFVSKLLGTLSSAFCQDYTRHCLGFKKENCYNTFQL